MNVSVDTKQLESFITNLRDGYELETSLMTATQNIARVLHQYLLPLTPVKTGNLRKMWSAGDNLRFTVERTANGFKVTLINDAQRVPTKRYPEGYRYATAVNDGHSHPSGGWVMGRFFVEKSMVLTQEQTEKIVYKELQKWWRKL